MIKRLLIILFSSFLGIVSAPDFLTASDSVTVTRMNDSRATETVIVSEPEPESNSTSEPDYEPAEEPYYRAPQTEVAPVVPEPTVRSNSIQIAGRDLEIVDVDSTLVDAGGHVNKYGDKFLYGHNSWSVFGNLANLGVGDTFSVYYNGVNRNYSIAKIVIYEKNPSTGRLQLNGSGNYMNAVAKAKSDGVGYDLSIMTCAGTSYGNGDASHRLVIFANSI